MAEAARPTRVYFFSTCVVDLMAPQAGLDAIELIRAAGIEVDFPAAQTCCGQPAYTSGYTEEARRVARAQLDLFPQPWPIVVPSGSCAGMMVHEWPTLFAGDARLAGRRATRRRGSSSSAPSRATCSAWPSPPGAAGPAGEGGAAHLVRGAARDGHPRAERSAAAALPGVELVEPARVAECCGFGGTFSARHPAISGAMVNDKLDSVRDSGAEVLVSADCGCLLNMHLAADKRRAAGRQLPRCVHLASFVRERLGAADAARQVTD